MRAVTVAWRKNVRRSVAAGAAALALAVTGVAAAVAPSAAAGATAGGCGSGPVVGTADGLLRGTTSGRTREFLGDPYAAPVVGTLRGRPPQPAASWRGVRAATSFAPLCPQAASPFGEASPSEDCLYLNVYTPPGGKIGNRPV